jgi:hypothetical protein
LIRVLRRDGAAGGFIPVEKHRSIAVEHPPDDDRTHHQPAIGECGKGCRHGIQRHLARSQRHRRHIRQTLESKRSGRIQRALQSDVFEKAHRRPVARDS